MIENMFEVFRHLLKAYAFGVGDSYREQSIIQSLDLFKLEVV